MAEPFLKCPSHWLRGTLEASPALGLVERVESGGTPSTAEESFWDGDIPWLTPKEISQFEAEIFVSTTERRITEAGLRASAAKRMPPGTVMLTKRAPVGAVAVNAVPMCSNQGFLNFVCGPRLRPLYLAYWLRANRPYLDRIANGSTYPELYKGDLFEIEISVPCLEEQDRVLALVSTLRFVSLLGKPLEQTASGHRELVEIQEWSSRLSKLCGDLLIPLFSGEIDVSQMELPSLA